MTLPARLPPIVPDDAGRADTVDAMRAHLSNALLAGDYDHALALAVAQGQWLREQQIRGELPAPDVLRRWHDTYQGLLAHVQVLRDDTRRQLQRMHKGRDVSRAYAAA
ncbi:MAG: hypothetical protein RIK00_07825 [Algiphilus sp.]|uniref:hypothetical protein n=1 Tax=Algiphilus sp. TaxID=1872431 RepID=UPI0032EC70FE